MRCSIALWISLTCVSALQAADGNRLTYLDENDPYYVSRTFPKLTTPQWVGEDGVDAVVVLAIDDMRDPAKYETFLRPILRRLQQIDGRAPVSIMTCKIDPQDPQLQKWLKEGLSLECHTVDHPCPLLKDGDFAKARSTYERCIDLLSNVPGNRPVAFRMPCCDSLNTPSPRFYAEIFNLPRSPSPEMERIRRTFERGEGKGKWAKANFLEIDSSVFNLFTSSDPELPRELVLDRDGRDKFLKYIPTGRSFVNTIENYPYPYVIGNLCWQFPCVTPSDWSAQFLQKPANPITLRDWKAALDATVIKKGVFCLVFHPYGWSTPQQLVDFIDHAVTRHGKKVKFLNFREARDRLTKNLLGGQPVRKADGSDNGVRLLDLDNDGYLDVVIGNDDVRQSRRWSPKTKSWVTSKFPTWIAKKGNEMGCRFGIVRGNRRPSLVYRNFYGGPASATILEGASTFKEDGWIEDEPLLSGWKELLTIGRGRDEGVRLRDLDSDGRCELIVSNPQQQAIYSWDEKKGSWAKLPFSLPVGQTLVNAAGTDNGLRFVDVDEDGRDDVVFSNETGASLHLFASMEKGWDRKVFTQAKDAPNRLPMITRQGSNMGAWVHSRHIWWQNEHTALLPNLVNRRSFNTLLENVEPAAKSPQASLQSIRVRPGFRVELMAAEPLVQDPIAFAWGPDGKFWVVEMGDYPLGGDGKGKPGGRVKFLEDTDGDGKYDKATVFLDGLKYPTNVLPWRKGILITAAPDILYAEDTDGDGKADKREVLFTGFVEGNPQHRVNGLVWGLDNWIYGANGDSGGEVKSLKTGKTVNIRFRDFRIRPDEGLIDLQTGQTQYGRNRDDWGNWFGNNNSNPMWHFVLSDHYLRRNPHLPPPDPRKHISVMPGAYPVFPQSRTLPRFNDFHTANHITSACSAIVYRDDLFGPAFAENTFVSEPVHNLVHREVMSPQGYTFTSRRAPDELTSEFLASSDNWFRPTSIQTGPDGALWIADMYRAVIEHPQWIPKATQERLDLRAGHDMGRIYRVVPVGAKQRAIPRLDWLDTAGLVAALDSPNGWQRDLAQMMLLWKKDTQAIPLLVMQVKEGTRPLSRLHSLCTLDSLGGLPAAVLMHALRDPHAGLRRHAVRIAEGRLNRAPDLGAAVLSLLDDADAQVRLQVAYTLGEWNDPRAGEGLGKLAIAAAGDRYLTAAVMSSVKRENLDAVLLTVLKSPTQPAVVENLLKMANALNHSEALGTLLAAVTTRGEGRYSSWQFAALAALLDNLDLRNTPLTKLRESAEPSLRKSIQALPALFAAARATVKDSQAARDDQLAALRLLGRGLDQQSEDISLLAGFLTPQSPAELQTAAATALGRLRDPKVANMLVQGWKSYGPALRAQVVDLLLGRAEWSKAALAAIEDKTIAVTEIDAARRQRLLQHRDAELRKRAGKLFADATNVDRQKVIDGYQSALTLSGQPAHGAPLFLKHCASCHKLGTAGNAVGPDLASLGDKSSAALLVAVLDPNRAVESRYINYAVATQNGLTLTGVLTNETGTSITLAGQDGKPQVILRKDLAELVSTGRSPMPEGLEKELKPQDLADLFAYIRTQVPLPQRKTIEGNQPDVIRAASDGSLLLSASKAEIYGKTLTLEKKHGNLGYWNSEDDHAVWTVDVPRAGNYAVWLDWACNPPSAGKTFALRADANELTARVASTGGWDTYRQSEVGHIILPAGQQRLTLRPANRLLSASPLFDLRSIKLVAAAVE